jgi:hypothetical protein
VISSKSSIAPTGRRWADQCPRRKFAAAVHLRAALDRINRFIRQIDKPDEQLPPLETRLQEAADVRISPLARTFTFQA